MNVFIRLTADEVNAILVHMGNLPSSTGVWPLLMNIKQQAEMQLSAASTPAKAAPADEEDPGE
tara:strand:+ start:1272 stop:1460 length:189 start_codon:yes stop_codon:yes gene_type:complete